MPATKPVQTKLFYLTPEGNPRVPSGLKSGEKIPESLSELMLPDTVLAELEITPPKKIDFLDLHQNFGIRFAFYSMGQLAIAFLDFDEVKQVLGPKSEQFAKGRLETIVSAVAGWGLFTQEKQEHKEDRIALNPAFHKTAAEVDAQIAQTVISDWSTRILEPDEIFLLPTLRKILYESTVRGVFGLEFENLDLEFESYLENVAAYAADAPTFLKGKPLGYYSSYISNRDALNAHTLELAAAIKNPKGDEITFGSILNQLYPGEIIPGHELHGQVATFIAAGTETSASLISSFISHHAGDLNLWKKVRQEIIDGDDVSFDARIKEILRVYPPAPLISRVALEDAQVNGTLVPAGTEVFIALEVTNRMTKYYSNPDDYDHTRWFV